MKHMETAPGMQDTPGGARYDPLKAGSVACRPSACPSTGRRRGGEASAAIDARGQPRGQPGDLCSAAGNLTTPPVVHDTRPGTLWEVWGSVRFTESKQAVTMQPSAQWRSRCWPAARAAVDPSNAPKPPTAHELLHRGVSTWPSSFSSRCPTYFDWCCPPSAVFCAFQSKFTPQICRGTEGAFKPAKHAP